MPAPGSSVGALLLVGGPAHVSWLVVAVVVDAVDRHAFGANTQLGEPLVKRLKAKLDVGVSSLVAGLATSLSLSVAAVGAFVDRIFFDAQSIFRTPADSKPFALSGFNAGLTGAGSAAGNRPVFTDSANNSAARTRLVPVGVMCGHKKEGSLPLIIPLIVVYHFTRSAQYAADILPLAMFLA